MNGTWIRAVLAVFLTSGVLVAEEQRPQLESTAQAKGVIGITYEILDGQEIPIEGAVGTAFGGALYFVDDFGTYQMTLDAGREVRKQLEGCTVNLFVPELSNCRGVGMAEVQADWKDMSVSKGVEIGLIVYELEVTRTD